MVAKELEHQSIFILAEITSLLPNRREDLRLMYYSFMHIYAL